MVIAASSRPGIIRSGGGREKNGFNLAGIAETRAFGPKKKSKEYIASV